MICIAAILLLSSESYFLVEASELVLEKVNSFLTEEAVEEKLAESFPLMFSISPSEVCNKNLLL